MSLGQAWLHLGFFRPQSPSFLVDSEGTEERSDPGTKGKRMLTGGGSGCCLGEQLHDGVSPLCLSMRPDPVAFRRVMEGYRSEES